MYGISTVVSETEQRKRERGGKDKVVRRLLQSQTHNDVVFQWTSVFLSSIDSSEYPRFFIHRMIVRKIRQNLVRKLSAIAFERRSKRGEIVDEFAIEMLKT